jgi:2-dehydropantoate 2-reductase
VSVLVVGAGPLGLALAVHLQRAGQTVHFLVRPGQQARVADGAMLYRLTRTRPPRAEKLAPAAAHSDPATLGQHRWDSVWLCVPSPALRDPGTERLREATGGATIVSTGQGIDDLRALAAIWPPSQIVQLVPSFFAYPAPLDGESLPGPGIAYWTPPRSVLRVTGTGERARAVARELQAGGLRATVKKTATGDLAAALNIPYFVALEEAGWSIAAVRKDLRLPARAARQAAVIVTARHESKPPPRLATSPAAARMTLTLLSHLAPFDLQAYAKAHFSKLRSQTAQMIGDWIGEGRSRGLPVDALEALHVLLLHPAGRPGARR